MSPRPDPGDLRSPRLQLRPARWADLDSLIELNSDPAVMRFINGGIPLSPEDCARQLSKMLAYREACAQHGFWIAETRGVGDFVGWFHLRPDRWEPELLSLGYRLGRAGWGRGFASEGAQLLVDAAAAWGEREVVADALRVNQASLRVMRNCGLQWRRDMVYEEYLLPGWPAEKRLGVQLSRRLGGR